MRYGEKIINHRWTQINTDYFSLCLSVSAVIILSFFILKIRNYLDEKNMRTPEIRMSETTIIPVRLFPETVLRISGLNRYPLSVFR